MGKYKLNPFTGKLDYFERNFQGVLASDPSSPEEGWMYINSSDNKMYVYYGGTWQAIHILTPAALEFLLMETGDYLLLENGDKIVLD